MFAEARSNFWIGFERYDLAIFPDDSRGKKREEANIRTDIVRNYAGTEILLQSVLHFRLGAAFEVGVAGAWIQVQPQPLRRTALDLHPGQ